MPLTISIIIPTLNEEANIQVAIERAWRAGGDEVIVVDGASTDQTPEICKSAKCHFISGPRGRGPQLNAGASAAKSDFLLFLHADNWLAQSGCDQIRERISIEPSTQFGAFEQRIENARRIYRWIEFGNKLRVQWRGLIYGDQALFVRKSLFEQVGGFPDIVIMEDLEFSRSLKEHGRPAILPGPTIVDARRWERQGVVRQTLKNWWLSSLYLLGASPEWVRKRYRPHND